MNPFPDYNWFWNTFSNDNDPKQCWATQSDRLTFRCNYRQQQQATVKVLFLEKSRVGVALQFKKCIIDLSFLHPCICCSALWKMLFHVSSKKIGSNFHWCFINESWMKQGCQFYDSSINNGGKSDWCFIKFLGELFTANHKFRRGVPLGFSNQKAPAEWKKKIFF